MPLVGFSMIAALSPPPFPQIVSRYPKLHALNLFFRKRNLGFAFPGVSVLFRGENNGAKERVEDSYDRVYAKKE